jgi:redox-sensitive bicupin YhaK (pirin superfamily)
VDLKNREIAKLVRGQRTTDGAGVRLVRVLGNGDVRDFDPFLMLDSFDSTNSLDYTAGFPMHPHRGIETITYLISGRIDHEDSMGNRGSIGAGESQWMTAGSGILHQEMPQPSDRMLGFQLWLNLPHEEKMTEPAYLSVTRDMIPRVQSGKADVAVLSGHFGKTAGVTPAHIFATIYDVALSAEGEIEFPTVVEETVFVFLIEGDAVINGRQIPSKTAVLFGLGDSIGVSAAPGAGARFIFFSAKPLNEPVAWGGPIVMNTEAELQRAFDELRNGTFIKHR